MNYMNMSSMQKYCIERSKFWFPKVWNKELKDKIPYYAIALAGEAGELCNEVKKRIRDNADNDLDIMMELADVAVYCFNFAEVMGCNLEDLIIAKMSQNEQRWGKVPL